LFSRLYFKKILLHLAMTNWLIHRLLTAKRHISDIPAILCWMTKWKWLTWGDITSYIHGDVLTIGVLLLIICLAWGNLFVTNGWKGVYVFAWIILQKLGLKEALVRQQSWDWVYNWHRNPYVQGSGSSGPGRPPTIL
jgi:hypothetical protein